MLDQYALRLSVVVYLTAILLATVQSAASAQPAPGTIEQQLDQAQQGQRLFNHDFSAPFSAIELARLGGDGLGPLFNERSCVACHRQGGIGGGGPSEDNVGLLSFEMPQKASRALISKLRVEARQMHPAFSSETPGFVLHRFGFGADRTLTAYEEFRHSLLRGGDPLNWPLSSSDPSRQVGRLTLRYSERNTPALFGAGLLDQVSEATLVATAKRQRKQFPGISGRVGRTADGAVGRFGWRAQTANLHGFVLAACANELGLEVPGHRQVENAMVKRPDGNKASSQTKLDLSDQQCDALVAFVARLPAPQQRSADESSDPEAVGAGERLFEMIGCATCHIPSLGPAVGVYSDLLLHDMGPRLADSHSAFAPPIRRTSHRRTRTAGSYSGGSVSRSNTRVARTNLRREWRTAPLWGVADSAPYLHDGRATTLAQSIELHAGEARAAASAYRRLDSKEQRQLIAFLQSLVAPAAAVSDQVIGAED